MSDTSGNSKIELLQQFLRDELCELAPNKPTTIESSFHLTNDGGLDSIQFVKLLGKFREKYGVMPDLSSVNPDEFLTFGGLCTSLANCLKTES